MIVYLIFKGRPGIGQNIQCLDRKIPPFMDVIGKIRIIRAKNHFPRVVHKKQTDRVI